MESIVGVPLASICFSIMLGQLVLWSMLLGLLQDFIYFDVKFVLLVLMVLWGLLLVFL